MSELRAVESLAAPRGPWGLAARREDGRWPLRRVALRGLVPVLAALLPLTALGGGEAFAQSPETQAAPATQAVPPPPELGVDDAPQPVLPPLETNLGDWRGLKVVAIRFAGVEFTENDRLLSELAQKAGQPLDVDKVRQTTRRLFATGRYINIAVHGERQGNEVTLIFAGVPRYFVGRVEIHGVKDDRLSSLLEYGSKLGPGTPFARSQVTAGADAVKQVLEQNGYHQPVVTTTTRRDDAGQQVDVTYTVAVGPQARVGEVSLEGKDPGFTADEFRKKGKLKRGGKVTRDTTSTALNNIRKQYQKKDRLEAVATLQKSTYDPAKNTLNYDFHADQGPMVKVQVEGAKFSRSRLHLLVPVYEEGAVDLDLLNEGTHNIKDYLQQQGYFDATVAVRVVGEDTTNETVLYTVDKGVKHKVRAVSVKGNKYFSEELLKDRLKVQKADNYQRSGRYSQSLVASDESSIQDLYRANGFSNAKVTSTVKDVDEVKGKKLKVSDIQVIYNVEEGTQQVFGTVNLGGVDASRQQVINGLLNSRAGQPFSLVTLSGDRDAVLAYYLSNGFDEARVEVAQKVEEADKSKTNVTLNVTEGPQVFIGKVLVSGIHHTHPRLVKDQMKIHDGDPLDQSALLETQRNLYNLALFNEVVAVVQNPAGEAEQKNALVQLTEAKRWDVTYGFGFEAQTGTPSLGQYQTAQGTTKAQEGKAGVSPRVSLDVSRINLRGTDQSLTLHTTYGLLEEVATLTYQAPHIFGNKNLMFQTSGGYSNVQNITTFQASTLQGDVRATQKVGRKDTFIYDFQYRRVEVNPNSLAIAPNLIPLLSEPVRVGGPGITWYHDTRSPSPLDAQKGSYTSVQQFLATTKLGSQVGFSRTDVTNATYYSFGRHKYVLARSTRFGFIVSPGDNPNAGNASCVGVLLNTNASCNPVPLPERLYAGGGSSFRGFPINGAGPRDLQTGYPVGGSGAFVNITELRLPAPVLPYVGTSVSFVLFHDMGNVFQHVGDVFPSIRHFRQPNEKTCEVLTNPVGTCDFNYYSHDLGIGARYATPVGPIRVDFSYNLNPPRYPVIPQIDSATGQYLNGGPYVGQAAHFNFFFSIGQSF
ncbi:POTRA domain-containing protein [Granulicella sp. WH15]|uniref:POTRA domain-containing protein n=1 Tax=Granulicella sp. WH15 TaxID=2602070 RepID=UPI002105E3F7|nr:POTRA domain-containing protein [Granulicella sp. WH15]